MPQVNGGPSGLNSILESAYSSAISNGASKESASKIAWSAAKNKYVKHGDKWVEKFYGDLGILVLALNKVVSKTDAKDYEYFLYPLEQFAKEIKESDDSNPIVWLNINDVMLNSEHNPIDNSMVEEIKNKIKESKEVTPLVYVLIDNDGVDVPMIADGYHRYLALKELGYKLIPARLSDERGTKTTERDEPVRLMTEETTTEKFEKRDDRVEWLSIDEFFLNPYHVPGNREIIDEKKDKIKETGRVKPLLYSEIDNSGKIDKIIVDGYHRFIALKELGYNKIPVVRIDRKGVRASDALGHIKIKKDISSVDVTGLELVRQSLQGKPKRPHRRINEDGTITKGGPGSGRHPEGSELKPLSDKANYGDKVFLDINGKNTSGTIHSPADNSASVPPYKSSGFVNVKLDDGSLVTAHKSKLLIQKFEKGGPGSGCQGSNCGRPSTGVTKPDSSVFTGWSGKENNYHTSLDSPYRSTPDYSSSRKEALDSANKYVKTANLPEIKATDPVKVNPENGKRLAQAYESMPNSPDDPKVKSAYKALGSEVENQYKNLPVKVEFTSQDPYKSSKEMFDDVHQNKKLKVFTGGEEHPLLGQKDENGISLNDKFRAVHDYYGHAMFGHQFGPSGEENAWTEHSKMFSPEAQKALTTETRGQNSWYNFSAKNEGKAPHEREFAEQKVGILPDEFLPENARTKKFEKGGEGSGRHPENPEGHSDRLDEQIEQHKSALKSGKINLKTFKQRVEPLYALKQRTESFSGQTLRPLNPPVGINKGGPGSGCNGPNCGRPSSGSKAWQEPIHSGNHIKEFLKNNNVVIATTDRSGLSPEKNIIRNEELEKYLIDKDIPYKKGNSSFGEWGKETAYIISAPTPEDSDKLKSMFFKQYKQDAILTVRNGHAVGVYQDGRILHGNVDKLQAGEGITDNYFEVDGQKFRLDLK